MRNARFALFVIGMWCNNS